jgi:hypothetical protein
MQAKRSNSPAIAELAIQGTEFVVGRSAEALYREPDKESDQKQQQRILNQRYSCLLRTLCDEPIELLLHETADYLRKVLFAAESAVHRTEFIAGRPAETLYHEPDKESDQDEEQCIFDHRYSFSVGTSSGEPCRYFSQ